MSGDDRSFGTGGAPGIAQVIDAALFAAQAHRQQRRKGEVADPYVNHVIEVADRLARATGGNDPVLIMAALLHDTVEDCAVSHEDIADRYGPEVSSLVAEVTDDRSLAKAERKREQVRHSAHMSERARMIKVADKTSNLLGVGSLPGVGWPRERRLAYVRWADEVIANCRGCNAELDENYDAARSFALRNIEGMQE